MSGIGTPGGAKADGPGVPGTGRPGPGSPGPGGLGLPGGSDPSMEDILASIRRILSEDENAGGRPAEPPRYEPPAEPRPPEVFNLDASMIVDEPRQPPEPALFERSRSETAKEEPVRPEPVRPEPVRPEPVKAEPVRPEPVKPDMLRASTPELAPPVAPAQQLAISSQPGPNASPDTLVAPAAAAAAAQSIGSLRRTLDAERQPAMRGSGITVEEMVREELRPMLKTWLDENLAPIVERLVRAEIERVVGRSNS